MIVLDASALLAFLFREPGHERVAEVLATAVMSTVNLSEVLGRFVRDGRDPSVLLEPLRAHGLRWFPFTDRHALTASALVPRTRPFGLSLGDRACLALGLELGLPVMTADRVWASVDLAITVETIR
ncbi:MAG TPA: type II toxin-antitoxin system VapC family toxin [Azospirillum sp.]